MVIFLPRDWKVDKYAELQNVQVRVRCYPNDSVTISHPLSVRVSVSGYISNFLFSSCRYIVARR
jgi:hypothetical protein